MGKMIKSRGKEGYDIIGDIHGHADELIKLLEHLGYRPSATGYQHPTRQAIFLGDFIDRGEHLGQHRKLLDIVMPMVRNEHAKAVMGNHEFNALAYHTLHEGEYLRPRDEKNTKQHQAFLNEFEFEHEAREEVLNFFYSLPMWLDLDEIRVVHACWDKNKIKQLKEACPDGLLSRDILVKASTKGTPSFYAIETILKGFEVELPDGISFLDKDKHKRHSVRVQWWNSEADCLGQVALPEDLDIEAAYTLPLPSDVPRYESTSVPCFIGHYWLDGEPAPLAPNVACLDYSVAKEGKLVAYRWSGEAQLSRSINPAAI